TAASWRGPGTEPPRVTGSLGSAPAVADLAVGGGSCGKNRLRVRWTSSSVGQPGEHRPEGGPWRAGARGDGRRRHDRSGHVNRERGWTVLLLLAVGAGVVPSAYRRAEAGALESPAAQSPAAAGQTAVEASALRAALRRLLPAMGPTRPAAAP